MRILLLIAMLFSIVQAASCGQDFLGSFQSTTNKMDAHLQHLNKY
jgi:hypothetical protein